MPKELAEPPPTANRWPSYQPMVLAFVAFGFGIFLDRQMEFAWVFSFATSWACLLSWFLFRIAIGQSNHVYLNRISSTLLLIGLIFAGSFWHHGRWNWFGAAEIGRFANAVASPACVDATVVSEPRWMVVDAEAYEDGSENGLEDKVRTRLVVRVDRIRDGGRWIDASGKADLVIHDSATHVKSGDQVRVFGRLVRSSPPSNPGQFDFQQFYRAQAKLAFLHAYDLDSVVVLKPASWQGAQLLSNLRHRFNQITWKYVGGHEAGFASAILLGNREQLSRTRRDSFLETGTVHLLAISGLHVGILAASFFLFFRIGLLSRRKCLLATMLFVFFYAWLVEFRPPVCRAAILIVLFCAGRLLGEKNFSFNLLAIAGVIVLLLNPSDLFGLGPQLSFLAVATLTFGRDWVFWPPPRDPIQRLIASTRPWHVRCLNSIGRKTRTAILVSGLIWIVAMPMVAYRFHLVAPIALIVNPLLLIPIAWALYGGLGVLVSGWFAPFVAYMFGWFCERNLGWIEWMIGAAQSVPFSHFWTAGPPTWALIVFYAGLFLFAVYPPSRLSGRWIVGLGIGWLVFGWVAPDQVKKYRDRTISRDLVCTFIDVGHGSSVLVELPNGKNLLYDAGSFGADEYGARSIAGVLWSQRIEHLDGIILSHADVDHFNAVPHLVEQFSIDVVFVSKQMLSSDSSAVKDLFSALKLNKVKIKTVCQGDQLFEDSGAKLDVVAPTEFGNSGNDNSNSVVLSIEHLGRKILLPGDLEDEGLESLLSTKPVDYDLVMAAHHGSKNSQPKDFMAWATPEFVVISGGSQRVNDQSAEPFGPLNRRVARTDRDGAVRFSIGKSGKVGLQTWNDEPWR